MSASPSRFVLASARAGREIVGRLAGELRLGRPVTAVAEPTYYDTFDGRLYRNGMILAAEPRAGGLLLRLLGLDGEERLRATVTGMPEFRPELPPGELGDEVRRRIGIRRLLPQAAAELRRRTWSVLDGEDKTVARLVLETGHARRDGHPRRRLEPRLRVEALRGYEEEHQEVAARLAEEPAAAADERDPLALALAAVGVAPGGYSSKPRLALDPGQRADAAVKQVLLGLLDCVEANEPGVRRDLDSEFLHDFRVAVRRSRSILGQLKAVFPARTVARFQAELKWLGGVTGPLRDLDVFLLELPALAAGLPAEEAGRLAPLGDFLDRRQQIEHRRVVRQLDSARYRRLLRSWRGFLARPVPKRPPSAVAGRPIGEVAAARIWRVWRRIRKRGRSIDRDSPPDSLHRLRIGCKKLRYLLEFFGPLYDPAEVGALVKALKKLQDNLGDFNDAVVQAEALRELAAEMVAESGSAAGGGAVALDGTLLAMGRVIDQLGERRDAERKAFAKRWRRFDSPRNRKRFRRLFKTAGGDA